MDQFDEKHYLYEQMSLIMKERRELTKLYVELKERLEQLDVKPLDQELDQPNKNLINRKEEIEYQKYMLAKNDTKKNISDPKTLGFTVASILKETGRPLSSKELFEKLIKKPVGYLTYSNFTNNILPKLNKDSSIHVERACRGYWQYRFP